MIGALEPMLATSGRPSPARRWAVEPKLDGWRALVHVDERVTVRTRSGRIITESVPELADLVDVLDGRQVLLDGDRCSIDRTRIAAGCSMISGSRAPPGTPRPRTSTDSSHREDHRTPPTLSRRRLRIT